MWSTSKQRQPWRISVLFPGLVLAVSPAMGEWGGLGLEGRYFPGTPLYSGQQHHDLSLSAQFEYQGEHEGVTLTLVPFLRLDGQDRERTHFDVRQAMVGFRAVGWTWNVGVGKVFWGVAELTNPVDVINQTDLVEDPDTGEKLGQPMVHVVRSGGWGTIELFSLPGFRERRFPRLNGRLHVPVDVDHPVYESSRAERHVDWAARWSRTFENWDLGVGAFWGTRRDPRLVPDASTGLATPHYDLSRQVSVDLQGAIGNLVLKLEGYYRETRPDDYFTGIGGFEYTLYGVGESGMDLGLIAEYIYDGRANKLDTSLDNDLFLGTRLSMNDQQSTEVRGGLVIDTRQDSLFWRLDASRRLGEAWKLELEIQGFPRTNPGEPAYFLRRDGYARLQLLRYF